MSDLPTQVYLAGQGRYEGNGDVFVLLRNSEDIDTLPAGKIQNGQVLLNLPDDVGKYLEKLENPCDDVHEEYRESCQSTFSWPKNLAITEGSLYVKNINIPSKRGCDLYLRLIKLNQERSPDLLYFSEAGKINGTITYDENETSHYTNHVDWNYSKGWNITYDYSNQNGDNNIRNTTTNLSKTGGTLEWWLRCDD